MKDAIIDVFISHANADKRLVRPLVDALLRDGFAVFVDNPAHEDMGFTYEEICSWENKDGVKLLHYLEGGDNPWDGQLSEAIEKAGAVLGILSPSIMGVRKVLYQEMHAGYVLKKLFLCTVGGGPGQDSLNKFFLNEDSHGSYSLFEGKRQQITDINEAILKQLVVLRGLGEWPASSALKDPAQQTCFTKYAMLRDQMKSRIGPLASQLSLPPNAVTENSRKFFVESVGKLSLQARAAFIKGLYLRNLDGAAEILETVDIKNLAKQLTPINSVNFIGAVSASLSELQNTSLNKTKDLADLRAVATAIVPMIADYKRRSQVDKVTNAIKVKRRVGDGGAIYLNLETGARTMAEIIVAASEERPARMREHGNMFNDPMGEQAMLLGPEAGPDDADGVEAAADFLAEIYARDLSIAAEKSLDVRIETAPTTLEKHIWQTVRKRLGDYGDDEMIELYLEEARLNRAPSHYLIVRMPTTKGAREYFTNVLGNIHKVLPSILILLIDPAGSNKEDRNDLKSFWYTLKVTGNE